MEEKKRNAIIAGIVGIMVVCILLMSRCSGSDNKAENTPTSGDAAQATVAPTAAVSKPKDDKDKSEPEKKDENEIKKSEDVNKDKKDKEVTPTVTPKPSNGNNNSGSSGNGGSSGSSSGGSLWDRIWHRDENNAGSDNNGNNDNNNTESVPTQDVTQIPVKSDEVTFPYSVPGYDMVIRSIESYEGIFLEDGSDAEVSGIAVMILENTGDKAIEYADFIFTGSGDSYTFACTDIPAGGVAVVQEKNGAPFQGGVTWDKCDAAASYLDVLPMSEDKVSVTDNEDGTLTVRNITEESIPCVRIFYKFYSEEDNAYVGGITYMAKITDLEAGAETNVAPSHYAHGYSKVMMVRTYDTADD